MVKQNDGIAIILIVFLTFVIVCGLVACVLLARARNIDDSEADSEDMRNQGVEDDAGENPDATPAATAPPPPPPAAEAS